MDWESVMLVSPVTEVPGVFASGVDELVVVAVEVITRVDVSLCLVTAVEFLSRVLLRL